ncbi:hypothetical protein Pth03_52250 [Planotetraspora thailandica]|uniref:Uncharacterized protein n=1 Tax=Planotetraspora thailandica TaxID=487172 RepID=A0A8J3V8H7_9ACTN|nr:hypothetical protein Pth03_52250 [Planotetraspora thailandica]
MPQNGCISPYARKYAPAAVTTADSGAPRSCAIAISIGGIRNLSSVLTNATSRSSRGEPCREGAREAGAVIASRPGR